MGFDSCTGLVTGLRQLRYAWAVGAKPQSITRAKVGLVARETTSEDFKSLSAGSLEATDQSQKLDTYQIGFGWAAWEAWQQAGCHARLPFL